jgi:hypothetical protein
MELGTLIALIALILVARALFFRKKNPSGPK